jgi:hypothetical protein
MMDGSKATRAEAVTDDCDSSVDTNDAFMEMLGLSSSLPPESLDLAEVVERPDTINCIGKLLPSNPVNAGVIDIPSKCSRQHLKASSCLALTLSDVLDRKQCHRLIDLASNGFRYIKEATHNAPDGTSYTVEIQNPNPHKLSAIDTSHNVCVDDGSQSNSDEGTAILNNLFLNIRGALESHPSFQTFSQRTKCGKMRGLNPRMRVLRYDAKDNDRFEAHFDATTFVPSENDGKRRQSLITVLVYLNNGVGDEFEGGETLFLDCHNSKSMAKSKSYSESEMVKIDPMFGKAVLFEHDLFHSGAPLEWGTKFIMRTDILFDEVLASELLDEEVDSEVTARSSSTSVLVSDLCNDIKVSDKMKTSVRKKLDEIGLLHITCESLLAPGIKLLKQMLVDVGLDEYIVDIFVQMAVKSAK